MVLFVPASLFVVAVVAAAADVVVVAAVASASAAAAAAAAVSGAGAVAAHVGTWESDALVHAHDEEEPIKLRDLALAGQAFPFPWVSVNMKVLEVRV